MPQKFPITFKEEQESPVLRKSKTFQGLGIDYGLIFRYGSIANIGFTLDGIKMESLAPNINYNNLFFDKEQNKLYYTRLSSLYEWPNKLIKDFETQTGGIAKYKKEIVVVLYGVDEITNSEGKILFDNLLAPYRVREFQGKLYYSGNGGLVEFPNKKIATTGAWTIGLGVSSDGKRIYFGGADQKLYSYDGKEVKNLCSLKTNIWSIHAVKEKKEVIYCAGSDYGIEKIIPSSDRPLEKRTILENISDIASIVHAPIDFIKQLKEKK
jgi:hypothetical protein